MAVSDSWVSNQCLEITDTFVKIHFLENFLFLELSNQKMLMEKINKNFYFELRIL